MSDITISRLSKEASVKVSTIRYYQKIGLFPLPQKNQSGYHIYDSRHLELLKFIKQTQEIGFSLSEIKEIIVTRSKSEAKCGEMKNIVDLKIEGLKNKIQDLTKIKNSLANLSFACSINESPNTCAIIEVLGNA